MGLVEWNALQDVYDYLQQSSNLTKIGSHTHVPGQGKQIPTGGIQPGAITVALLDSGVPIIQTGSVFIWPVSTVPSGYLTCDGTNYLISSYTALYNALGGSGNPWDGVVSAPASGYFSVPEITFGFTTPALWVVKT
jgi:hypothetical protein